MGPRALRDSLRVYQTCDKSRVGRPALASRFYRLHQPLPFEAGVKAAMQHQIEQHRRDWQRLQHGAGLGRIPSATPPIVSTERRR